MKFFIVFVAVLGKENSANIFWKSDVVIYVCYLITLVAVYAAEEQEVNRVSPDNDRGFTFIKKICLKPGFKCLG